MLAIPGLLGVTACARGALVPPASDRGRVPRASSNRERLDELREHLPRLADYAADTIPGFQIACVLDGEVAWTEGYGVRAQGGAPVDAATVFDLGSLTKPMFAAAVLRLRDRGVIDLDAPLLSYFDYPDVRGHAAASKVTARHVLGHTTGLPNWRPFAPGSALELKAPPGERFGYSGEGFFWLQQVIEEVTGIPTARLVRQEVLTPLGLEHSSLVFEPRFASNYAQGHRAPGTPPVDSHNKRSAERVRRALGPAPADLQDLHCAQARAALIASDPALAAGPSPVLHPANAAGSLQATAADYARFLTAFFTGLHARPLLGASTVKEMLSPQTAINRHTAYGLGWRLEQTHEGTAFWHSGYNDGFHSFALGDPTQRSGVVVVTNSDRGDWLRWPVVNGATGRGEAAILS